MVIWWLYKFTVNKQDHIIEQDYWTIRIFARSWFSVGLCSKLPLTCVNNGKVYIVIENELFSTFIFRNLSWNHTYEVFGMMKDDQLKSMFIGKSIYNIYLLYQINYVNEGITLNKEKEVRIWLGMSWYKVLIIQCDNDLFRICIIRLYTSSRYWLFLILHEAYL